jgi:hypothetical protein
MTPAPAETDIFTATRALLLTIVPSSVEVVKGLDNRVPAPQSAIYVVMTAAAASRLSTNAEDWDMTSDTVPTVVTTTMALGVDIQLDVHGAGSLDVATAIAQAFRSSYSVDFMTSNGYAILPQSATDPRQSAFINGESQYEERWITTLTFQASSAVDIPAQFASDLTTTIQPPVETT